MPKDERARDDSTEANKKDDCPPHTTVGTNPAWLWWPIIGGLVALAFLAFLSISLPHLTERVKFFTANAISLVVLLALIVQVVINSSQWGIMQEQKKMAAISERAYLGLKDMQINRIKNVLIVTAVVVNGGRTPAWGFHARTQVYLRHEPVPFVWDGTPEVEEVSVIFAGGDRNMDFVPYPGVTQEVWNDIISGKVTLFVDGECRYLDFTGEKQVFVFGYTFNFGGGRARAVERYQRQYPQQANPN